ncbi:MAG: hypothetical protein H0T77_06610 [Pyrinomonadaceae bacterium]|nr:hypothetical protein [Pyrinomonadaceae bacterium]
MFITARALFNVGILKGTAIRVLLPLPLPDREVVAEIKKDPRNTTKDTLLFIRVFRGSPLPLHLSFAVGLMRLILAIPSFFTAYSVQPVPEILLVKQVLFEGVDKILLAKSLPRSIAREPQT